MALVVLMFVMMFAGVGIALFGMRIDKRDLMQYQRKIAASKPPQTVREQPHQP